MRWKKKANFILAVIFSFIYSGVTFLSMIGPLHINSIGGMNQINQHSVVYNIMYWMIALVLTWHLYFTFKNRPRLLFFTLIIVGISLIIGEDFVWHVLNPS